MMARACSQTRWDVSQFGGEMQARGADDGEDDFIASLPWSSGGDGGDVLVTRAPGRLDVMGGIADYSGALVLQLPLREGCYAALRRSTVEAEGAFIVTSHAHAGAGRGESVRVPLAALVRMQDAGTVCADGPAAKRAKTDSTQADFEPISWDGWVLLKASWPAEQQWAAYVVGGLLALLHAGHVRPTQDSFPKTMGDGRLDVAHELVELVLSSSVPEGKGVSSSAAVEVAALSALAHGFGVTALATDATQLALCAQLVENKAVGAPCGVMDQMASALGRRDHLMALECQPATVKGHVPLPTHVRLWGLDSGVRHSVGGADYGSVRTAAFIGKTLLAHARGGEPLTYAVHARPSELDSAAHLWHNGLAPGRQALDPPDLAVTDGAAPDSAGPVRALSKGTGPIRAGTLSDLLPETLLGAAFLAEHPAGHGDAATTVDPARCYSVRAAVSHPIREHCRVQTFSLLLGAPPSTEQLSALGELMYQSHASYSSVGLGSEATDDLVRRVRVRGPRCGLFGAKITGGGSGGTVCVLTDDSEQAAAAVREIAAEYGEARLGGQAARIFEGSSGGASQFGALLLRRRR